MPALTTTFIFGGEDSVSDPTSAGTLTEAEKVQDRAYVGSAQVVNFDVDDDLNLMVRPGYERVVDAQVTSAWQGEDEVYCISYNKINRFGNGVLELQGNSPEMDGYAEFVQVNKMVVFSDNTTIGGIEDGVLSVFSVPAESTDILDLETWVALTYPAGKDKDESNIEINAFNLSTFAGKCLTFYNGALYLAVDNFIFCTKTFNVEQMDFRYNVVAGFNAPVTMIRAVTDGLFVGTEKGVYFLAGQGVRMADDSVTSITKGFTQRKLAPFGVVYGSAVTAAPGKVPMLKAVGDCVIFMTTDGIYAGKEGGVLVDLTDGRLRMPVSQRAAAQVFDRSGSDVYVVAHGAGAIAVNLSNAAHSTYDAYPFTGFFYEAGVPYGTSPTGVYRLDHTQDNALTDVAAYVKTPSVDFGQRELKRCDSLYIHAESAAGAKVSLYVDGVEVATDLPTVARTPVGTTVHRFRAKLPLGAVGTNWQFKISNVNGAALKLYSAVATPTPLKRSI